MRLRPLFSVQLLIASSTTALYAAPIKPELVSLSVSAGASADSCVGYATPCVTASDYQTFHGDSDLDGTVAIAVADASLLPAASVTAEASFQGSVSHKGRHTMMTFIGTAIVEGRTFPDDESTPDGDDPWDRAIGAADTVAFVEFTLKRPHAYAFAFLAGGTAISGGISMTLFELTGPEAFIGAYTDESDEFITGHPSGVLNPGLYRMKMLAEADGQAFSGVVGTRGHGRARFEYSLALEPMNPIPEPSTIALLAIGCGAALRELKRRHRQEVQAIIGCPHACNRSVRR